tara:strand:+ start:65 stop:205 length:141 start_codon:yes stop_codon:yes gene_type:complete
MNNSLNIKKRFKNTIIDIGTKNSIIKSTHHPANKKPHECGVNFSNI